MIPTRLPKQGYYPQLPNQKWCSHPFVKLASCGNLRDTRTQANKFSVTTPRQLTTPACTSVSAIEGHFTVICTKASGAARR